MNENTRPSSDEIRAAIRKYEATTDNHILDRICTQQDLEIREQLSPIEQILVSSVYIAFLMENINDILEKQDRKRLEAALEKLIEIPEIKHSEKLSQDLFLTLCLLAGKEDQDFVTVTGRFLKDWILISRYYGAAGK